MIFIVKPSDEKTYYHINTSTVSEEFWKKLSNERKTESKLLLRKKIYTYVLVFIGTQKRATM